MMSWIFLILGSVAGGTARYAVTHVTHHRLGFHFPFGTLLVNLSGCLLIGFLNSIADAKSWVGPNERLLLMTGFCGAFTTFSSFIMETSSLFHEGQPGFACLNVTLSVVLGFLLFRLGAVVGRAI